MQRLLGSARKVNLRNVILDIRFFVLFHFWLQVSFMAFALNETIHQKYKYTEKKFFYFKFYYYYFRIFNSKLGKVNKAKLIPNFS